MNTITEQLYTELRLTQIELQETLQKNHQANIQQYIKDELKDVESTIKKLKNGNFGICELSGELIPLDLLKLIPTIKSREDVKGMESFYRKSIH